MEVIKFAVNRISFIHFSCTLLKPPIIKKLQTLISANTNIPFLIWIYFFRNKIVRIVFEGWTKMNEQGKMLKISKVKIIYVSCCIQIIYIRIKVAHLIIYAKEEIRYCTSRIIEDLLTSRFYICSRVEQEIWWTKNLMHWKRWKYFTYTWMI